MTDLQEAIAKLGGIGGVNAPLKQEKKPLPKPMGKQRPIDKPYLIIDDGVYKTHVLKAFTKNPEQPYARWYCAVQSPFTYGGWDIGSTYVSDITGVITYRDPEVTDEMLPEWLRSNRHSDDCDELEHWFG